jgi:hypothetical protein
MFSLYYGFGFLFDSDGYAIVPSDGILLAGEYTFCGSEQVPPAGIFRVPSLHLLLEVISVTQLDGERSFRNAFVLSFFELSVCLYFICVYLICQVLHIHHA